MSAAQSMRARTRIARRRNLIQSARYAGALFITLVVAFPIYWLFLMAFKSADEVYAVPPVYFPAEPSIGSFASLFRGASYDAETLVNSLIIATSTTIIAMVLGTMCAYSMARFRTGGHNFAIWIMSQRMLPPIAIVFPLFLAFAFVDILDTFPSIIVVYVAFNLPFVIWMMRGYIEDVPVAIEESALVDGCTRWQVLYKIIVPMSRAGIFATAVFTFLFTWNEFVFAPGAHEQSHRDLSGAGDRLLRGPADLLELGGRDVDPGNDSGVLRGRLLPALPGARHQHGRDQGLIWQGFNSSHCASTSTTSRRCARSISTSSTTSSWSWWDPPDAASPRRSA